MINLNPLINEEFEFIPVYSDQVQHLIDNLLETNGPVITGISSTNIKAVRNLFHF